MTKSGLLLFAAYYTGLGVFLFLAPRLFYETVPGVSDTGSYNDHFLRDVGLAFLLSAAGLGLGALRGEFLIALFGVGFPVLHGLLHLAHWGAHGMPFGGVEIFELTATVLPAGCALFLVLKAFKGARS